MVPDRVSSDSEIRTPALATQAPIVEVPPRPVDIWLITAVAGLLVLGTIEVFSASAVYALKRHGDSFYFLKRQVMWLSLGFSALWVGARCDYRWLRRWTYPLLTASLLLLVAVLIVGGEINGARRWFVLGPLSVQPVELSKLALVCYLAYSLGKKADAVKTFTVGFIPHLLVCAIMMALLLRQPDLGSALILGATTITLLFVAGTKISYIALALLAAASAGVFRDHWNPPGDCSDSWPTSILPPIATGVAYQVVQSQIAIGSGGVGGTGLGSGRQQLGYVPEAHSDFVLASLGEELGYMGICLVLVLLLVLLWRGSSDRRTSPRRLRQLPGLWHRRWIRISGAGQHRCRHGALAGQGIDASVCELRWIVVGRIDVSRGHPDQHWTVSAACCAQARVGQCRWCAPPPPPGSCRMRLMIAGGGTGGHVFPGIAVAEELVRRDPDADILFVGTERGIETKLVPELGWNLHLISVSGLKTVGLLGAVRGLLRLPRALWQSRKVLKRFRPDVVIGVGGYASGPVVMMARLRGIPTAILEQNSIPGMTNKVLGKMVRRVFLSFDHSRSFFKARKVAVVGNPTRLAILDRIKAATKSQRNESGPRILVCGGSQGALAVNELMAEAAGMLAERGIPLHIVHQTGHAHLDSTRALYEQAGVEADCRAFISDMAAAYADADLVVSRAGATTVAELGIAARPAILIPYPHAADNHQEVNAREMVEAGAALMARQSETTAAQLADEIATLITQPDRMRAMAAAMRDQGHPDASAKIVDWCAEQARG